jgi:hypothetical protein
MPYPTKVTITSHQERREPKEPFEATHRSIPYHTSPTEIFHPKPIHNHTEYLGRPKRHHSKTRKERKNTTRPTNTIHPRHHPNLRNLSLLRRLLGAYASTISYSTQPKKSLKENGRTSRSTIISFHTDTIPRQSKTHSIPIPPREEAIKRLRSHDTFHPIPIPYETQTITTQRRNHFHTIPTLQDPEESRYLTKSNTLLLRFHEPTEYLETPQRKKEAERVLHHHTITQSNPKSNQITMTIPYP